MEQQRPIIKRWPFNGAAFVYVGARQRRRGAGTIVTSGSSTTVTSGNVAVGGSVPQAFSQALVGDEIKLVMAGVVYRRYIRTKNSHDSVVVDTAINIPTAHTWTHLPHQSGLTDAVGWVNVQHLENKLLFIQLNSTASGAGITYSVEGRGAGDNNVPRELATGTLTAAVVAGTTNTAAADTLVIPEMIQDIRIGVKNDAGGIDNVSAWITGVQVR